ncbi:serine/threonine-protein kinase [Maioricimonas rarisocia]|nr:serine/threonine-protein kinase [Maioricimonas rarisocia]
MHTGASTRLHAATTGVDENDLTGMADADDWKDDIPVSLGKYTVEGPIGRGGMGVVWKAHDPDLSRTVAIKVLAPHLAQSLTARRRFQREARAAAAISHPHVLTIHHVEEQNKAPFLVMEYIAGGSLKEFVAERGKLDPVLAIQLCCQIAQGLAAAHAQGVIHRDVKPSNVMLHEGGVRVRIADFGLARAAFDNSDLTSHDHAVGTPAYMAPEQLRGARVDARADLFSLGCVMHYMLIGHSPFQGRTQAETIHKILGQPHRSLLDVDPTIPPALAEIVDRLLQKNPDERYQSAFEVAALLERYLTMLNQAPTDEIAEILASPTLSRQRQKRGWLLGVGTTAGGMALIAFSLWMIFLPTGDPFESSPGTANMGMTAPEDDSPAVVPGAPPRVTRVITVAETRDADFHELEEAIAHAKPGDTVRVVDGSTYAVNLNLRNRRDLILETTSAAELVATDPSEHLIQIHGGRGIRIRGFRMTTTCENCHAIALMETSDVQLEDLEIDQQAAHSVAAIHVADCNASRHDPPLVIRSCRVRSGSSGQCLWIHADPQPVWNLVVENNRFFATSQATVAVLWGYFGEATIRGNIFASGGVGLNMNLLPVDGADPDGSSRRLIGNRFFRCRSWIGLMSTEPALTPFILADNLILESENVEATLSQQAEVAEYCSVDGNVWEHTRPSETQNRQLQKWVRFEPEVAVQSRNPSHTDFLRLPDDSPFRSTATSNDRDD